MDDEKRRSADATETPKRLLFVANSIPFPPRDGVELPSSRILEHFTSHFRVDLLVTGDVEPGDADRAQSLPTDVRLLRVLTRPRSSFPRLWHETFGRDPAYFGTDFIGPALGTVLGTTYDLAWVSPVSEFGFIRYARRAGHRIARHVAIGLNDATTTLYTESFRELLSGRVGFSVERLLRGARAPSILRHESRYLKEVDLVHVQTEVEARRVRRIAGKPLSVVVAPNGVKEELRTRVSYRGDGTRRVLYMTHLDGQRARESRWFLDEVWPRVRTVVPDAQLWLVGTPPDPGSPLARHQVPGVHARGYVPDLAQVYDEVDVAVVPIFHGTGLINRLQDAIAAGIPTVTMPRAASTIDGLDPERHVLVASNADQFADHVNQLLTRRDLRSRLASECQSLAQRLPTWQASLARISAAVDSLA